MIWLLDLEFFDDFDLFRDAGCLFKVKFILVFASIVTESSGWLRGAYIGGPNY